MTQLYLIVIPNVAQSPNVYRNNYGRIFQYQFLCNYLIIMVYVGFNRRSFQILMNFEITMLQNL